MELYKLSAADLFKGINLKKLENVRRVEEAAEKIEKLYLGQHEEMRENRELAGYPDDVVVILQQDSIRDLVKELCFYKALAIVLDTRIRAAESANAACKSQEGRRQIALQ